MDYGNPGNETMSEGMHEDSSDGGEMHQMGSLFLDKSMLPDGMAETLKPGEILEFRVIGTDKDGEVEVSYNTGKDEKGSDEDWASELKHSMSAREPEETT